MRRSWCRESTRKRSRSKRGETVPNWEESLPTPAVFVRVANKEVAGYGTWKCVRRMEEDTTLEQSVNHKRYPLPCFSKLLISGSFKLFRMNTCKSVDSKWFPGGLELSSSNCIENREMVGIKKGTTWRGRMVKRRHERSMPT